MGILIHGVQKTLGIDGRVRTLKNTLANSVNTISARIMDMVGPRPVVDLIKKTGITSFIPNVPSIALGTPDISLFELVGAWYFCKSRGYLSNQL